jgi:hypothetical protein
VAAPHIAVLDDGNTGISFAYLLAAAIPDSQGNVWSLSSPDVVTPAAVAGPTTTSHHDGALFDGNGNPRFAVLISPHWATNLVNLEAVAETGEFLHLRTLLIAECQSVRTFENNGHFITDQGVTTMAQPSSVNYYQGDQPVAQDDGLFSTIGGSDPSFSPTSAYVGTEGVDFFRILRGTAAPNPEVVILANAFQNPAGGRVMYFGGHQYTTNVPLSTNGMSHGVRYFLNAIFCAPSVALPQLTSAVSRKTHGAAGAFDIDLQLTGPAGIECRSGGTTKDYTMVLTFGESVSVNGSPQAAVTAGTGTIGSGGVSNGGIVNVAANVVTIPLTNVDNAQTINVTLNSVNGAGNITVPMGVLVADANANGTVNASDVSQTKSRVGQTISSANFRSDVNANGSINASDVSVTKSNVGTGLP